jgi:hypothetical protein
MRGSGFKQSDLENLGSHRLDLLLNRRDRFLHPSPPRHICLADSPLLRTARLLPGVTDWRSIETKREFSESLLRQRVPPSESFWKVFRENLKFPVTLAVHRGLLFEGTL